MPHTGTAIPPATDLPIPDEGLMLGMVCLMLLTELHMHLGLDEDGSATTTRALGVLGMGDQLEPLIRFRVETEEQEAADHRRRLRAYLRRAAPLMSRLARPAVRGLEV